jgi:competence protein ComEC
LALVEGRQPLTADFLKAVHHGSKTPSTEDFLAAMAARPAAVSVAESSPFGHPAESVVKRLDEHGVKLLRTDRHGAITALTDGSSLFVGPTPARAIGPIHLYQPVGCL